MPGSAWTRGTPATEEEGGQGQFYARDDKYFFSNLLHLVLTLSRAAAGYDF